jgi:hypothetical protein
MNNTNSGLKLLRNYSLFNIHHSFSHLGAVRRRCLARYCEKDECLQVDHSAMDNAKTFLAKMMKITLAKPFHGNEFFAISPPFNKVDAAIRNISPNIIVGMFCDDNLNIELSIFHIIGQGFKNLSHCAFVIITQRQFGFIG